MKFKTYVINLDKSKERWNKIVKQLNKVNLDVERFPGYLYKDIPKEDLLKKFKYNNFLSNSMIGCSYSHLKLLENFLKTNDDICLILEDDAYPIFKNINKLNILLKNNSFESWDVFKLHSDGFNMGNINNVLTTSAAAYFVTRKGAKKILNLPIFTHFDTNLSVNNMLGNLVIKNSKKNLFYTNEDLESCNRKNINKNSIFDILIDKTLFNKNLLRGEKTWKHIKNYTFINIPIINYNLIIGELLKFFFIFFIFFFYKKKYFLIIALLLITSNKNIII